MLILTFIHTIIIINTNSFYIFVPISFNNVSVPIIIYNVSVMADNNDINTFVVELDSEIIDQDIDKIDLYAERTVDYDSECDIEFQ